jgi:hypothetical protein
LKEDRSFGACLAGTSVTKTATLLGVSRTTVTKMKSAYTNHGKTASAKRNSGQKSVLTERDCHTLRRIVCKNHTIAAAQVTAELNIHFQGRVFTKIVRRELKNPTSTVALQWLSILLLKVMIRCVNDGVTTIKPGHRTNGNARII